MTAFSEWLRQNHACSQGIAWVGERTLAQAWAECPRADWLVWALREGLNTPWPPWRELAEWVEARGGVAPDYLLTAGYYDLWCQVAIEENRELAESPAACARIRELFQCPDL